MHEIDEDESGTMDFREFLEVMAKRVHAERGGKSKGGGAGGLLGAAGGVSHCKICLPLETEQYCARLAHADSAHETNMILFGSRNRLG